MKAKKEEIKKSVYCSDCKHSNRIIDRGKIYCKLKQEYVSAYSVDCFKYVKL